MLVPRRTFVLETSTANGKFGVLLQGTEAYDGYMAIPIHHWGHRYRVATLCGGVGSACQLVVLAKEDSTTVTVTLPPENQSFRLDQDGVTYTGEVIMTKTLMQDQAWVIQKPYEMTGALVVSTAPVGVIGGAVFTDYMGSQGAVTEQLPPLTTLGKEYVSPDGGTVRVVSTEADTTIWTSSGPPARLSTAGEWVQGMTDHAQFIRADRPVLVVQFGRLRNDPSDPVFPVLFVLTPVTQFLASGISTVMPAHFLDSRQLWIVTSRGDEVTYGFQPLSVVSTSSQQAEYSPYDVHVVQHGGGGPVLVDSTSLAADVMALYILSRGSSCSFLAPLARSYDIINPEQVGRGGGEAI